MIHRFMSVDHPEADGRVPLSGEQQWTISIPLEGGDDYLELRVGTRCREAFLRMFEQEAEDDRKVLALQAEAKRLMGARAEEKEIANDWRLGLRVKIKYQKHSAYGYGGIIVGVYPSGAFGIVDLNGVLRVRLDPGAGFVVDGADQWVSA